MEAYQEKRYTVDGFEQSVQCIFRHLTGKGTQTVSKPHYHDYIEILYGIEGEAEVLIGDRWHVMRGGDWFAVNVNQVHDVICRDGTADYFVIKFLPEILYRGEQDMEEMPYLLLMWQKNLLVDDTDETDHKADEDTVRLMHEIMREWSDRRFGFGVMIRADIIRLMVHRFRLRDPHGEEILSHIPPALARPMAQALYQAREHFATWTVKDAADACNLSYSYFSRVFRRLFGLSFCSYLEELRLKEGEKLLLSRDDEISVIAEEIGFHTASYFIDRFRRKYGMTPGVFRNELRKGMTPAAPMAEEVPASGADEPTYYPTGDDVYGDTTADASFSYTTNPANYDNDPCAW